MRLFPTRPANYPSNTGEVCSSIPDRCNCNEWLALDQLRSVGLTWTGGAFSRAGIVMIIAAAMFNLLDRRSGPEEGVHVFQGATLSLGVEQINDLRTWSIEVRTML